MRLIDADKLLAEYDRIHVGEPGRARKLIEEQPTVDAVEVVRCKDCKHNSLKRLSGNALCDLGIGLYQVYDFCSNGERKETEDVH